MSTSNLWRSGIALAMLAVLLLAAGCASSESTAPDADTDRGGGETIVVGTAENGSQMELASGQELEVTLESNPTTGCSWEVVEVDKAVLTQVGDAEFRETPKEDEQMVGVGGTETFCFAASTGETTLTLVYHRPWEKDVEPLETFTVRVTVQ